jgi:putative hydrolase of the HAD superfamily
LETSDVIQDLSGILELLANGPHSPKVIFFDAVGTLFEVRDGVGAQYAVVADRFGVVMSPKALDEAFAIVFKQAGAPVFPSASLEGIPKLEFDWWRSIVLETLDRVGVLTQLDDFDRFFEAVFQYFATEIPWTVYPETIAVLNELQQNGIALGIISNFDSRIDSVLKALKLDGYFQTVTISTAVGAAKPDGQIFQAALGQANYDAGQAWHVGDSRKEDVAGAIAAGLRGIWVDRN